MNPPDRTSPPSLFRLAEASLVANIVTLGSGTYLTAGRNQFKTLWTRDFALAARGLLQIGRADVVRNHLGRLIEKRRPSDALVPRVMDSMKVGWRVVRKFLTQMVPPSIRWFDSDPPILDPLVPEYQDEHGTEAIDSNLLVLLASLQYVASTGDREWWNVHEPALRQIYHYYDEKLSDGLVRQARFSDWQDSVRREGRAFYTNLLYSTVSERLAIEMSWPISAEKRNRLRSEIQNVFFDPASGLFRSLEGYSQISVDGNLLAIDLGFYPPASEPARALYANLKKHPLWNGPGGIPGQVTVPAYPPDWKSLAVRFVNLRNYHEDLYWSWLMALSGKVALLVGDRAEGERIYATLEAIVRRDGAVAEIFVPEPLLPVWRSRFFSAEMPFSWGAAFAVDLSRAIESLPTRE